jgi:hypothetical protein
MSAAVFSSFSGGLEICDADKLLDDGFDQTDGRLCFGVFFYAALHGPSFAMRPLRVSTLVSTPSSTKTSHDGFDRC